MKEFTLRAVLLGSGDVRGPGRRERLPGAARRADHRGHLSGGGDRHGGAARVEGTVLEENIARTAGSIGESVAAGAIFTMPAFLMSGSWTSFDPAHAYWKSTALMVVGGILGVLFVSLVRRALVEDPVASLPRIGGRGRNSQGRTARRRCGPLPVLEHRPRHADPGAGRSVSSTPSTRISSCASASSARALCAWAR